MPRSVSFCASATAALLLTTSSAARADITAFLGTASVTAPHTGASGQSDSEFRTTKGLAVGFGLVIVGFEFEWSNTSGNGDVCGTGGSSGFRTFCAPSLATGMGNVLLQTPHGMLPFQIYGTVGAGMYREHYSLDVLDRPDENDYGVATNVGGGVKIDLVGPLRVRVDYRIFKLENDAFNETPQRFYVGANLAF